LTARTKRRPRRPPPSPFRLRWVAIAGIAVLGLLYYRPLTSYVHARHTVARRSHEVRSLLAERRALEKRIDDTATGAVLTRQARRLGFVKPGERLFIVKGIDAWRRAHATTIGDGG
jgi:cell division protein FtsB